VPFLDREHVIRSNCDIVTQGLEDFKTKVAE
jgi:hypothetical protein